MNERASDESVAALRAGADPHREVALPHAAAWAEAGDHVAVVGEERIGLKSAR